MPDRHTIFIVDDHQLIVDGLTSIIELDDELELVGYANNGEDAVTRIPILKPDMVLMDLDMPRVNGLRATELLLKEMPALKVVILTLHHERSIVEKAMKTGASGYILKNAPRNEFIQGIKMVLRGTKYYSSSLTETLLVTSPLEVQPEANVKLMALLNEREIEILRMIAEGASSKEMADTLHLSPQTIDSYRKSMLKKLNAKNAADLIRIAIKEGLIG